MVKTIFFSVVEKKPKYKKHQIITMTSSKTTVFIQATGTIDTALLVSTLPGIDSICSLSMGWNQQQPHHIVYALRGEFKTDAIILAAVHALDQRLLLTRIPGFGACMYKAFKDNDDSRFRDEHYKALFNGKASIQMVYEAPPHHHDKKKKPRKFNPGPPPSAINATEITDPPPPLSTTR